MTTRTLTRAETQEREHAMAINLGRCSWCAKVATQACHRLPEGQGGPYIKPNLLPGCGLGNAAGCHGLTENRRALSYSCGWLIRSRDGESAAGRSLRIAATPTLIRTQLGTGWHLLDFLDDGRPVGMPRLTEPGEVPDWMFTGTYEEALAVLHGRRAA